MSEKTAQDTETTDKPPEETEEQAPEAREDDEEYVEDEKMDGLDGVFDVAKGKTKKKKKKKKKERKKKKKNKSSSANLDGVDGVISPDKDDNEDLGAADDYLGVDDLDDDLEPNKSPVNKILVGVIVVLLIGMGVLAFTGDDDDIEGNLLGDLVLLVQGDYQEEMLRRARAVEQEYMEAQREAIPKFGNLFITGSPQEALIYLNGEVQYGEISGERWRELRVTPGTVIEDLSVDENHEIRVEHPGHEPFEITLEEEMWDPAGSDFQFRLSVNLTPEDSDAYREFNERMDTDSEHGPGPYHGTVQFNTEPEGAHILVNSLLARDSDGEPIKTPAELDSYYRWDLDYEELDEEGLLEEIVEDPDVLQEANLAIATAGELGIDETKIEEHDEDFELTEYEFRVDTPPGRGNSIQLVLPDDHSDADELPHYATMLQRSMWHCNFKPDHERQRISDDAPPQEHCDYEYEFDMDLHELADYIERREEERERIERERRQAADELEEIQDQLEEIRERHDLG